MDQNFNKLDLVVPIKSIFSYKLDTEYTPDYYINNTTIVVVVTSIYLPGAPLALPGR